MYNSYLIQTDFSFSETETSTLEKVRNSAEVCFNVNNEADLGLVFQ